MYTNRVFGTAKCALFIEVSSFRGVLSKGVIHLHIKHVNFTRDHEKDCEYAPVRCPNSSKCPVVMKKVSTYMYT